MLFPKELVKKAESLVNAAKAASVKFATAESCTGGLVSAVVTDIAGASSVFDSGLVTYSNRAKVEHLTVPSYFMNDFGAVSRETAIAMAEGLLLVSQVDLAVSITGIAGPSGGSDDKPVGTVYMGLSIKNNITLDKHFTFAGSRDEVRLLAVEAAIDLLMEGLELLSSKKVTKRAL